MISINIGWWIIPTIITIISIAYLILKKDKLDYGNIAGAFFDGLVSLGEMLFILLVNSILWIIYLLLRIFIGTV